MAPTRVLPDTNVCYPISLLDLILRLDEADLHRVLWTEDLLDELVRVWVAAGARSQGSAEAICGSVRRTFPDQEIARAEYDHLIEAMPGPDPDDHVHSAAATARAPATILTANLSDFPADSLAERSVSVRHPDDYLVELFGNHPDDVTEIVRQMAKDRQRPPMTADEVLTSLERSGLNRFPVLVRPHL